MDEKYTKEGISKWIAGVLQPTIAGTANTALAKLRQTILKKPPKV